MKVHAAHGGRVAVECVCAGARLSVPHLERTVGAAADDNAAGHLRRPDASRVTHQRPQTLQLLTVHNLFTNGYVNT